MTHPFVSAERRLHPGFLFSYDEATQEGRVSVGFTCGCAFTIKAPKDETTHRVTFHGTMDRLLAKHLRSCTKALRAFERIEPFRGIANAR